MKPTIITQYVSTTERCKFKEISTEVEPLEPHEILLKIVACGVCHTDCAYSGLGIENLVLGHESVGKIIAVGSEVKRLNVGDIVGTSYLKYACLDCRECNSGDDYNCNNRILFPEGNTNGFATHQVQDSRFAYKIPKGMEPKIAASLFCAGVTVFNSLLSSKISPTGRVAVIGIGGLGHLALQFARAWGVHVTAISHSADKKEEALGFGAHDFLSGEDLTKENIEKLEKYDLILNTVSVNLDLDLYFSLLKRNSTFNMVGIPENPIEIKNVVKLFTEQRSLSAAVVGGRYAIELMLEFAQRHHIKPQIEEYNFDLDGLHSAAERCDKSQTRYRAILVDKSEQPLWVKNTENNIY